MPRRAKRISDPELSAVLREALERGAFSPREACRVIRALKGCSQEEFASRLGLNVKVVKALESGRGNLRWDSLERIAEAADLCVAFVSSSKRIGLLDADARAADEQRRREADARALLSGQISAQELRKRNAMDIDDISFELPSLA